jgi:hypothetical protein
MRTIHLLAFLPLAGCFYSPSVGDCTQTCGAGGACPAGLACDSTENRCRVAEATAPCSQVLPDAPVCDWATITPTNIAVDDLPASMGDVTVTTSLEYSTDDKGLGVLVEQTNGRLAILVVVDRFVVSADGVLTVRGALPLVLVADQVEIAGEIRAITRSGEAQGERGCFSPTLAAGSCSEGSDGGGGGGRGQAGAGGGAAGDTQGGQPSGAPAVSPVVGGCPGGDGGFIDGGFGNMGPAGGNGGGGLQIIATGRIEISGTINAGGEGGEGGGYGGTKCDTQATGGGGGGSGGEVLLEGCQIAITSSGRVCANGGGGGGGGVVQSQELSQPGAAGGCDGPAPGGQAASAGVNSDGGAGGYGDTPAVPGDKSGNSGGGGGGGGVGRIRFHTPDLVVDGEAVVSPAAVED